MGAQVVVFANLDGSRFDPYFDVTRRTAKMLHALEREGIPVVFFSTRTSAELELIQRDLGVSHPFVAENGGALHVPRGYFGCAVPGSSVVSAHEVVTFGRPYDRVVTELRTIARQLCVPIVGFSDMSAQDIAADCGLSVRQGQLAKLRQHGEPFRVTDVDPAAYGRLTDGLRAAGLECLDTGRYTHAGAGIDRGLIVERLLGLYRRAFNPAITVGIGDPVADLALLQRVDLPFIGTTGALFRQRAKAPAIGASALADQAGGLREIVETLHARSLARWCHIRH